MTTDDEPGVRSKDIWEKSRAIAPLVASLAVPLAVAWIGGTYSKTIKDSENNIRYVELAIVQLRSTPTPETEALRDWAVEILDSHSPIKLSPKAKLQLKSNALPLAVELSGKATVVASAAGSLDIVDAPAANRPASTKAMASSQNR